MSSFMNRSNYPECRRYIRIFPSVHNTTLVVNYMADNNYINGFLTAFDIFSNYGGNFKLSDDGNHAEVWFEMDKEFYELSKTETMQNVFKKKFGVEVVYE